MSMRTAATRAVAALGACGSIAISTLAVVALFQPPTASVGIRR